MIESGTAIIAACLPTLHHLFACLSIKSVIDGARNIISLDSTSNSSKFKQSQLSQVDGKNGLRPSHRDKYEERAGGYLDG